MKFSISIKKLITFIIIILVFFFFGWFVLRNLAKVNWQEIKINIWVFIVSVLFFLCSSFIGSYAWYKNLSAMAQKINYWYGIKVIALSQFGKYLPGKIWAIGGRVILAKKYGVRELESSATVLIEEISYFLSAMVLFLVSLGCYRKEVIPSVVYLAFLFIPLSLLFLHPKILQKILSFGARLGKMNLELKDLDLKRVIYSYFLYFLSLLIQSTGFFFLIKSIHPVSFNSFFGIIGAYSLAWALSFIIIFIPAGLGIREGILVFFLKFFIPLPMATLISIFSRLWVTLGEVLLFLIALSIKEKTIKPRENIEKKEEISIKIYNSNKTISLSKEHNEFND